MLAPARFWPWLYTGLLSLAFGVTLLAPAWLSFVYDAALAGVFFLLAFGFAFLALFWPHLRIRNVFLAIPVVALSEGLALLVFRAVGPATLVRTYFEQHGVSDLIISLGLLTFANTIAAVSLWMRGRQSLFLLRRAGHDREELERLFELKLARAPEENLTYLRFTRLFFRSLVLIGEQHLKFRGSIHALSVDETLFLFDLLTAPGEDEYSTTILRAALVRPELRLPSFDRIVYLHCAGATGDEAALTTCGFRRINPDEIDLMLAIRRRIEHVDVGEFEGWKPLGTVERYYIL